MLRRDRQIRTQVRQVIDACLFAFSFWLAYVVRTDPNVIDIFGLDPTLAPLESFRWLFLILVLVAPLTLEAQGFYDRPLICSRRVTAWMLFKGCLFTALALIVALFLFKSLIARGVVVLFGFVSFALVYAKEEIMRRAMRSELAKEQYRRRFILVGLPAETQQMRAALADKMQQEAEVTAEIDLNRESAKRLIELLHEHSINGVIFGARHARIAEVENAIRACELEGVEVWLVADFFRTQISRTAFDALHGWPLLVFRSTPDATWQRVFKQVLDTVISAALLVLGLPFYLGLASLVKISTGGPVFSKTRCAGLNGRPFTLYGFQTLRADAGQAQPELAPAIEQMHPVAAAPVDDLRFTGVGRFLREYHLENLPQLWNILRGDMSFVGPRPLPASEGAATRDLTRRRRLSVKPGMTCFWQISDRKAGGDFDDEVRMDLKYIDQWSLSLDMKILWLTVLLKATGVVSQK